MKKLLLTLLLLFSFHWSESQTIDSLKLQSDQEMYDFHFEKHKKQKKTGLIMLGSGVVAMGTGFLIASNSGVFDDTEGFSAGAGLMLIGSVATVVSIPVLISSGVNKKKASTYVKLSGYEYLDLTSKKNRIMTTGVKIEF